MASTTLRIPLTVLLICILLVSPVEGLKQETSAALAAGCIAGLVAILGLGMWFYDTHIRKYRDYEGYEAHFVNPYAMKAYTNPVNTISGKIELDPDNYGFSDTPTY